MASGARRPSSTACIVALIAAFIIGAVTAVGGKLGGTFQGVADALP